MTTFKAVLINIRRNFSLLILYIVIFLVMSVISLSSISDHVNNEYSELKPNLLISSLKDDSQFSREFLAYLNTIASVTVKETSSDEVKDLIESGFYDAELSVPINAEQLFKEGTLRLNTYYIPQLDTAGGTLIMQKIDKYFQFLKASYDATEDISNKNTLIALSKKANIVMLDKKVGENSKAIWYSNYVKFLAYVIIALFTTIILFILANFNEPTVYQRRFIAKTSMFNQSMSLGAGVGLCLLAVVIGLLIIGLIMVGFDVPIRQIIVSILTIMVFSATIASLALMFASFGIKKRIIGGLCNVLALGMSFMTGIFVPLEFLPSYVVKIAHFIPSYYYVKVATKLDGDFWFIITNLGIMVLFTLCFMTITWFIVNRKKQINA